MLERILRFFERYVIPKPIYRFFQPSYHFLLAFLGSFFYNHPSRGICVVGVTGTKGKSTVLGMLDSILSGAGRRVALLSSVREKITGRIDKKRSGNTMPGRFFIQRFLMEAVKARCEIALIEVTSEGAAKFRHRFIEWDGAVFLNLHPEHIESHGSFEKYREAKLSFFRYIRKSKKSRKFFVVNTDDPNSSYFKETARGVKGGELFITTLAGARHLTAELEKGGSPEWLFADFNVENALVAAKTAEALGIGGKETVAGLKKFGGLRGRMDFVQHEPFAVVVDYAHTPDSLKAVYGTLRKRVEKGGQLICVLGSAGGGRDKWKRPELGKIAGEYCDEIVLTSEDPYDENPARILSSIKSGIQNSKFEIRNLHEIIDRKEALQKAISLAKKGDVVVSTGMGSQEWFYGPRGSKVPWDEPRVVERILELGDKFKVSKNDS